MRVKHAVVPGTVGCTCYIDHPWPNFFYFIDWSTLLFFSFFTEIAMFENADNLNIIGQK